MWLGLDDADADNGCVIYVRGTKEQGLRPHEPSGVLGFSQQCLDYGQRPGDQDNAKDMVTAAGDLLVGGGTHAKKKGKKKRKKKKKRAKSNGTA